MNLKVFNLVSGVKETRFIVQHESCECKCELNESVLNLKQKRITLNVGASVKQLWVY